METDFIISFESDKLIDMKIMAGRLNMSLSEFIEFIFDDYAANIRQLDEKYNLDKYGKKLNKM